MGLMIARTWLTASMFMLAMSLIAAVTAGGAFVPRVAICTLVVLPSLWWPFVASRRQPGLARAGMIGAIAASLSQVLPLVFELIRFHLLRSSGRAGSAGLAALADFVVILVTLAQAGFGAVVGGLLGMLIVGLERKLPDASSGRD